MGEIVWQDPPAAYRGPKGSRWSKHWETIEVLKSRPGEWALVASAKTNAASAGLHQVIRRNELPIKLRTHKNRETGLIDVYAVWDWSLQKVSE